MAKRVKRRGWLRRLIRYAVLLIALGVLGALMWFVWLPSIRASITVTYDSYAATRGSISNSLSFTGSASVVNSGYATASAACVVRAVYVKDGDNVKSGDKLFRLSTGETVKAEFDGTINEIFVEEGDKAAANAQLCQIVDFANMKVTMRVDEYDISQVSVGQACEATFTALEKSFPAEIAHINRLSVSTGSVAYYTVTATVEVTDDVLPGMQVSVRIPKEQATDAVIIKMDALSFDRNNSAFVYVMNDAGALEARYVEVGVDNGNYIQIVSGLTQGEIAYVEAKAEAESAGGLAGLISSITGGGNARFNAPGGFNRNYSGANTRGGAR